MTYSVKIAGQDVTLFVDQLSIKVNDILGQGSGASSVGAPQGRASTFAFNTSLGPMSQAKGAGQGPFSGSPKLVRQGEVVITDASGLIIFGGYATKHTDTTTSQLGNTMQPFTTVEGIDYTTQLGRIFVNESYIGLTDIQVIKQAVQKYAPWVDTSLLPTASAYTFAARILRNVSLLQVIQDICAITGYLMWVDYTKKLHYSPPSLVLTAPFGLSDNPDFFATFPHGVEEYIVDDTSTINRVRFTGGKSLSHDFLNELSVQATGTNKTFVLAYFPHTASDGKYHVTVNGVEQLLGEQGGQGPSNTLISDGGTAQALINGGEKNIQFSSAPSAGATIIAKYRYEFPLVVVVPDTISHTFYGDPYLDGFIDDSSVYDIPTAVQRCRVLLAQQSKGLTTLKVKFWKGGVQAGQTLKVKNTVRGINSSFLVQEVDIEPLGNGNFVYTATCGAWNWNMVDVMVKLSALLSPADFATSDNTTTVDLEFIFANVNIHPSIWTKTERTGPYYARSAAVGDGHDAYPGFATIST